MSPTPIKTSGRPPQKNAAAAATAQTRFGYDAAETSNRRKTVSTTLRHEDDHLTPTQRKRLIANKRDLQRNVSLAGWIIRKHLDFVATHSFHAATGDKSLDADLEAFIAERSKAETFDAAGRHPAHRFFRMAEARRIIDGDILFMKLREGSLQAIEADRIRTPNGRADRDGKWKHGVRIGPAGRAMAYAIHKRGKWGGFQFEKNVDAKRAIHFATFDAHHRFDATRGVSPFATAVNDLRDLYEARGAALAKIKVSQMMGLVIKSDSEEGTGFHRATSETTQADTTGDGETETVEKYEVDLGSSPWKLELDEGDDLEIKETGTPASDSQNFMTFCLAVAMKSIDLPYNFFDESHTNFFGSKAAVTLYLKSAFSKRADHQEARSAWHAWQFRRADANGDILVPSGMTADELAGKCTWMPTGVPWLDMSKELRGEIMAIAAGFQTRDDVCRKYFNRDFAGTVEALKGEEQLIAESGITITEAGPAIFNPETIFPEA